METLSFDTTGWTKQPGDPSGQVWHNPAGDGIGLYRYNQPPDLPKPLDDFDRLRQFYRQPITEAGGGLIGVDLLVLDGLPVVRAIIKTPQSPSGMTYIGSYSVPRRDFSFVLKAQCQERGLTGLREAAVFGQEAAGLGYDEQGIIIGWSADPYDPTFKEGALRNLAEDERYDTEFPNHPLSRLRRYLAEIEPTIRFSTAFKNAAPFDPAAENPSPTKRPAWKFW